MKLVIYAIVTTALLRSPVAPRMITTAVTEQAAWLIDSKKGIEKSITGLSSTGKAITKGATALAAKSIRRTMSVHRTMMTIPIKSLGAKKKGGQLCLNSAA